MTEQPPSDGPAFEQMMREIDAALLREGVAIPARPLRALRAVSLRHEIPLPVTTPRAGSPPELHRHAALSEAIFAWYERVYGERLKIDFSLGRAATDIGGDLYTVRIPKAFGDVRFILSRTFAERPTIGRHEPVVCNVLQLVDDLSEARAASLPDAALRAIGADFDIALAAFETLEANREVRLMAIARGDIATAVRDLMDRDGRYGASKWASLQAAEKVLKAAIGLAGQPYGRHHRLADHCEQLQGLGVRLDWQPLVASIQCSPRVRYGEEPCSRADALAASRACLKLIVELARGGAALRRRRS